MSNLFLVDSPDDDLEIEPEHFSPERELDPNELIELETEPELEIEPVDTTPAQTMALAQILPADFQLSPLTKFCPNIALRTAADTAADYALAIPVEGDEGLQRADLAITAIRSSLKAIESHLEEPIAIANGLHKRLTTVRTEWMANGKKAVETVGSRIYTEHQRLDRLAQETKRQEQAEADARERAAAQRELELATVQQAPAPVVEELKRQALTATAPPVRGSVFTPVLRGSSPVKTWKCRLAGTPGSDEPNPTMSVMTPAQRSEVLKLMRAVLDGHAPLSAFELNWSLLNGRAKAEKSTFAMIGLEAFEEGGLRAKGQRSR